MTYRITIRSNPRLLIIPAIVALLLATAIAVFFVFGLIIGIVGIIVVVYLDYQLYKFLRLQLGSYVSVDEDGAHCVTSAGEDIDFPWESITHAGVCTGRRNRRTAFIYDEERDQLVTIPDSFAGLDRLISELQTHTSLGSYQLKPEETVRARLRSMLSVDEESHQDEV